MRFEVLVDGEVRHSSSHSLGDDPRHVEVDVTEGLRLKLQITGVRESCGETGGVFADPQLIGLPWEVPQPDNDLYAEDDS